MARKSTGSVAPKERINICYRPATGNAKETVELPFRALVLGDFHCRPDDRPVEEREPVNINKDNFDSVMANAGLNLSFSVKNYFDGGDNPEVPVDIDVKALRDLEPDALMQSIPQLRQIYQLRESLLALKGPLGNSPQMRRTIMAMLANSEQREQLLSEIKSD
jgi:type VI secretion system protein ImpB